MNQSILTMLAVPYLSLGFVGFFIYRGCKKNAEYRQALAQAAEPPPDIVQSGQDAT
jgi:hypothetical protein